MIIIYFILVVWLYRSRLQVRLLQRVRLAHFGCNLQNMTSLVCHSSKRTALVYRRESHRSNWDK